MPKNRLHFAYEIRECDIRCAAPIQEFKEINSALTAFAARNKALRNAHFGDQLFFGEVGGNAHSAQLLGECDVSRSE